MKINNNVSSQNFIHTQQKKKIVVDNSIRVQTSAASLHISKEAAVVYSQYISSSDAKTVQLQKDDIERMQYFQGDSFSQNPYSQYLQEQKYYL
ncbi:hypothetical protein MNB_SM-3-725 [hydrothermal vent metagenome]|uniref:Uncharacterized protein n=1 Tax=hydrothermal vent metagenome TaxID=652676 RepID=A0A1W1D497_9ZZZZ